MDLSVVVPPTYPPGCRVVFVGESPGPDEVAAGEGFVGKAGKLLQKIIYASGLEWADIGRSNVVKRPPDGGYDNEHFHQTFYETTREGRKKVVRPNDELSAWQDALRDEIIRERPNIAVACGNEALKALCGTDGISTRRGSLLPSTLVEGLKVVPILHPSFIQRSAQWQELYISSEIVKRKVVPQMDSPALVYDGWQQTLSPTIERVLQFISEVNDEFALDIETRAGSIACVGLSYHDGVVGDKAICVPIQTTRGNYFASAAHEHEWWRVLQGLMDNFPVIGQS